MTLLLHNSSSKNSGLRLLSHHGNVLLLVANNERLRIRDIAVELGMSERATQGIVTELIDGGYLDRRHEGRRNVYQVREARLLELPLPGDVEVRAFLDALSSRSNTEPPTRFDRMFEQSGIPIVIVNLGGRLGRANRAACDLFGQPESEVIGRPWSDYTHPDDLEKWQELVLRILAGEEGYLEQQRFVRPDGSLVWTSAYVTIVRRADNEPDYYLVYMPDISDRKRMEEQLDFQSFHDVLTGLANRTLLLSRLEHGLGLSRRRGSQLGVIVFNLDHFRLINSSLGHDSGDELLRQVAKRITSVVSPGDSVARLGSDEFVVVCDDATGSETGALAEVVLDALREPFNLLGQQLLVTASLGVAIANAIDKTSPIDLLHNADTAMARAKEFGGNRFEYCDESLREKSERRALVMKGLRQALQAHELMVHYQPIIDLSNGQMVSVEALLRWQHPELGFIGPAEFIPYAEEMGLIGEIGGWVVEQACTQLARWNAGEHALSVAVNISVLQMLAPDIAAVIGGVLARSKAPGERLCLEVTESVLMENVTYFARTLTDLKSLGVKLSIDDFGTGFSSLGRLKNFPIDELKVDQGFVKGLGTDQQDTALVDAIVAMAHALNLSVTAEGVENETQLAHLRSLGCQRGQGFYLARPMPASAIDELVNTSHQWELV